MAWPPLTAFGADTLSWDVRGRLVALTRPGLSAAFAYDYLGRRTSKTLNGVATAFLHDGDDLVSEITGGTSVHTLHGPVLDEPLARGGLYFTPNHLGSTTTLTDGSGATVEQYSYRPFGETTAAVGVSNPFQYTGRENDQTGLMYYRARYYAPEWGRFISEDPIGFLGGPNPYAYVYNNPAIYTDPEGEGVFVVGVLAAAAWLWVASERPAGIPDPAFVNRPIQDDFPFILLSPGAKCGIATRPASVLIRAARKKRSSQAAKKGELPTFDEARREGFEKAGMTDPSKVKFKKVDPKTGTVVEFEGPDGAKVVYDAPHQTPGAGHDYPHVGWQTGGKRRSGAGRRGNIPYRGPQHPSRSPVKGEGILDE